MCINNRVLNNRSRIVEALTPARRGRCREETAREKSFYDFEIEIEFEI